MEQRQLANLTLTANVFGLVGILLSYFIWVPYLRNIVCALVLLLVLFNLTKWSKLRKIDLLLNILWVLYAGWNIIYLLMYRV